MQRWQSWIRGAMPLVLVGASSSGGLQDASAPGLFHACADPAGRVVPGSLQGLTPPACAGKTSVVSWKATGMDGPAGSPGPRGPVGPRGADGPIGPAGFGERIWYDATGRPVAFDRSDEFAIGWVVVTLGGKRMNAWVWRYVDGLHWSSAGTWTGGHPSTRRYFEDPSCRGTPYFEVGNGVLAFGVDAPSVTDDQGHLIELDPETAAYRPIRCSLDPDGRPVVLTLDGKATARAVAEYDLMALFPPPLQLR